MVVRFVLALLTIPVAVVAELAGMPALMLAPLFLHITIGVCVVAFMLFFFWGIVLYWLFGTPWLEKNTPFCFVEPPMGPYSNSAVFLISVCFYKEDWKETCVPTLREMKKLQKSYGGPVLMVVADDGMLGRDGGVDVCSPEERRMRREYYLKHGFVWVARPAHGFVGTMIGIFKRVGIFKKGSNLNGALVAKKLLDHIASGAAFTDFVRQDPGGAPRLRRLRGRRAGRDRAHLPRPHTRRCRRPAVPLPRQRH